MIALLLALSLALPQEAYERQAFRHWVDADGDCQDTRAEILAEQSLEPVVYWPGGCRVIQGLWVDPYTGQVSNSASEVHVDHVVPLAYAWFRGAWAWTPERRREFANDRYNLQVVRARVNVQKGSKGPSGWSPGEQWKCEYGVRWISLIVRYRIAASNLDLAALDQMANSCPAV